MTGEQFQCCDCLHIGPLDIHGGCEGCHSQAVISQELISLRDLRQLEPATA
ncbi:MAG: hypothetical protein JWO19_4407 [Bryobacterales bacterium]|nr:hypothetical protein [Bryobacterales bacterium]